MVMATSKMRRSVDELKFTPRQKQCLTLYCCDNLSQSEIGQLLGINQRVVSQHITAARVKIARYKLHQPQQLPYRATDTIATAPYTIDGYAAREIMYVW